MMWNFCTWLDIHRSIKHSWLVVYTLGVFLVQKFGSAHFCLEKLAQFFWNKESYNKNCSKVFELYQLHAIFSVLKCFDIFCYTHCLQEDSISFGLEVSQQFSNIYSDF